MSKLTKPWLQKFHKNFFLIYVVTFIHFFWNAVNGIFGSSAWFNIEVLHFVNFVSPFIWGVGYLFVALMLVVGLFKNDFRLARIGLASGLFMEFTRFILILLAVFIVGGAVANTLANLLVVVGVLLSQLREPPVNPVWYRLKGG